MMTKQSRIVGFIVLIIGIIGLLDRANAAVQVYNTSCAACHNSGAAGAPMITDAAAWDARIGQGVDVLVEHAINGFGVMPARGGNQSLSDADIRGAVAYMLEQIGIVSGATVSEETKVEEDAAAEPDATPETPDSEIPAAGEDTAVSGDGDTSVIIQRHAALFPLGPPPVPADNPQSPEKVALGRLLFFDGRLGGNGTTSCATCHLPSAGWDIPAPLSIGYPGTIHWRNSQTIINSAYYGKLFWAGASKSLEAQAGSAASGAVAGNGESDMMEARLAFIPEYRERFNKVFGDEWPRIRNAWWAIAAFERTLIQTNTPYDSWLKGDDGALDDQQKRGFELFVGKANCVACHNGALLSDEKYYNLGVPRASDWENSGLAQITFRYELYAKGISEKRYRKFKDDPGLYFRTKQVNDLGKFRTPSLRYTKYTAPYMHNGQLATLNNVVQFYNSGGGNNEFSDNKTPLLKPLELSEGEVDDLVTFIESMSGEQLLMDIPQLPPSAPLNAMIK